MTINNNGLVDIIRGLWSEILSTPVGPDDNFFDLGGYSLLLLQMVSGAEEVGLEIAPEQVIDYPTPATLAAALEPVSSE